jgi:hypothetical protein
MGPARRNAARFVAGFVAVLVLVPALVWAIQAVDQRRSDPASPGQAAADTSRRDELGCRGLTCETEPPSWSPPQPQRRKPRRERRRAAAIEQGPAPKADPCDRACQVGTVEAEAAAAGGAAEQLEPVDEPRDATDLVGAVLAPATRKLPTDPLDEVDEVEEALEDAQAVVPDSVEIPPELEIQLDPAPAEPTLDPEPELPDPVAPTALLVVDELTAEELGISSRMTIVLNRATWRALAILTERAGLELSAAAPSSAESPRD